MISKTLTITIELPGELTQQLHWVSYESESWWAIGNKFEEVACCIHVGGRYALWRIVHIVVLKF